MAKSRSIDKTIDPSSFCIVELSSFLLFRISSFISAETKTLPCPLSTPPVGLETLVVNEGERDRFAVTAGRDGFS